MKDVVVLELYGKNGFIERMEIETCEWYDGETEAIDSDEYRAQNGVIEIHGVQYDDNGTIQAEWRNYYDALGRATKFDTYSEGVVTKSETVTYDEEGKLSGGSFLDNHLSK